MPDIEELHDKKYISLETYRKNDTPVRTPVWFVMQDDTVYVVTREKTGKVGRIRNNQNVRIAPCGIKGDVAGQWHAGKAERLSPDRAGEILKQRDKKYGLAAKLAKLASRGKGDIVAYSISLEQTG